MRLFDKADVANVLSRGQCSLFDVEGEFLMKRGLSVRAMDEMRPCAR